MVNYNGYTIRRTHALGPFTSVHEAAAADGRPGRFALKIFHPPPSTDVRRVYAIEGWLLAAERQQKSVKKDGAVLEVLAFGRCEEGAFAVLPWQESRLEPLIKTLHPKGDTLRALAECLLNTLEKWEGQTGGPHGNLKAANVFFSRHGTLAGMTAQLSDPAHLPGGKVEERRQADLAAIGAMLAQIVRRRPPGAWPIEDAPEWKALGHPGKGWLAFCNYLLNPSPKEGELTIAEARRHLRKIPRDANPVKTAALTLAAIVALSLIGVVAFARFGNPIYMPEQVFRLAQTLKNPQIKPEVPAPWIELCKAWDTWLIDLQSNAPRLLRTEALWERDDELRKEIANFVATANGLLPATLVPQAAGEKRLGVLASSPPEDVLNELQLQSTLDRVTNAGRQLFNLRSRLESWPRWNQLRALEKLLDERRYTRVASALHSRLPPLRGSPEFGAFDSARTFRFLRELSLDSNGALLVSSRWSEITRLRTDMEASGDRIQQAMPRLILDRLADSPSLGSFADSLGAPLEEMQQRRNRFLDPQVVRERFLKESPLQAETAEVTAEDFPRWEQELHLFSLVTREEDPRVAPELDASGTRLTQSAVDLEQDAPAAEPGGLPTFSQPDFQREFAALTASLQALRERPIVRRDLPAIGEETTQMAAAFRLMEQRMEATLALLKPEIWLGKVAGAYGKFSETRQRWAAWQATIASVTADMLRGDRPRFRALRAQERQVKEWIDGVEGPTGFGALTVPELKTASAGTAAELARLEGVLRERAVTAVANATVWSNALPTAWAAATAAMKAPLEAHRAWLTGMPDFAADLDRLGELLLAGFGWAEGVSEVMDRLVQVAGVNDLTGSPAEWTAEARELSRVAGLADRAGLTAAAQSGGLSRKLMAWRQLGRLAGWPATTGDFDLDTGVVTAMREFIGRDVKDESRRGGLLDELVRETRLRFNRAARVAAQAEAQLTAMFERMQPAGLTEADLDEPVAYNLALWRLKREDWNETNLERLRVRRDRFVDAVRAIPGIRDQAGVSQLLGEISAIELKDDPNRAPTPTPLMKGWQEEPSNEGLTLTATWRGGGKAVQIRYHIVQAEGLPPFYLAERPVAVGEFVDLINARSKEAEEVYNALPQWVRTTSLNKPWNKPLSWQPRSSGWGLEVNTNWILLPDSQVQGLLTDADLHGRAPILAQAVNEVPTARTPLQQIPPEAARIFAEQVLGARLPKPEEWRAVVNLYGKQSDGYFRGRRFRELWAFLQSYNEGGQVVRWRPNEGIFLPAGQAGGAVARRFVDDGAAATEQDRGRLWFAPVDEGPRTSDSRFINLFGNVWIYLCDAVTNPARPAYYVAGGSALSPPGVDTAEPQEVRPASMIGATRVTEGFTDVGIRPAFEAPPGFKERYRLLVLVREQRYLTM